MKLGNFGLKLFQLLVTKVRLFFLLLNSINLFIFACPLTYLMFSLETGRQKTRNSWKETGRNSEICLCWTSECKKISSFEVIFSLKTLADIRTGCNWSNHDCPNCNWSKLFQQTATGQNYFSKQQLVEVIYVNVVLNSYSTSYTFRPKVNNCHNHNWSKLLI